MIIKILLIIFGLFAVWQIVIRVGRKLFHFPAPAFIGPFLDSDFRRRLQPPDKLIQRSGVKKGMQVLEVGCGSGAFTTFVARAIGEKGKVYALDIQEKMLEQLKNKLLKPDNRDIKNIEMINKSAYELPFENNSFNGVFCTGTLHLFPKEILRQIFSEMDRILKPDGRILIDFATDIKRTLPDGKLYIRKSEPQYNLEEVAKFLKELLKNYKVQIVESEVPEEEIKTRGFVYRFSCKGIIVIADKK